jgi:hypothetical protein
MIPVQFRGAGLMNAPRVKFATQVDPDILSEVRALAQSEGRQIQALVDEALADLVDKRKGATARPHVLKAYLTTHERFGQLYRKLAE